jgi:hypothetical protein
VAAGTADITATTNDGKYRAVCQVTVEQNYVVDVTVTPAGPESLPVGKTRQLSAKVLYAYDAGGSQEVTWSTDNSAVATVSAKGLVTAVSEGTANIMAMAKESGKNDSLVYKMYRLTVTAAATNSENDALTLDATTKTCYAGLYSERTLKAPTAKVMNGDTDVTEGYTLAYAWAASGSQTTLGTSSTQAIQPLALGDSLYTCTVSATSLTDSSKTLTASCTYKVTTLQGTAIGAVTTVSAGTQTLGKLTDIDGVQTLAQQLLEGGGEASGAVAVPGLTHVVFDLDGILGENVGTLSAKADLQYYVSDQADGLKLSELTFTPAQAGTYTIPFTAYGDETWFGQLELVVTADGETTTTPPADDTTVSDGDVIACDSAGFTFSGSDFFHSSDADPVVSLVFGTPSAGHLVREFTRGTGAQDQGARYYTNSAANGDYHVSTLTYLPTAGYSGRVTIPVTLTTKSGQETQKTLVVDVTSKTASSVFTDVTADGVGQWAANAVDFAQACGLVSGMDAGIFSPNTPMTRAMLVTVLYRAAGQPQVTVTTNFTDLNVGSYYYNAVVWANVMGIVNGTSDTTFSPDDPVTRQQIAAILYRYASSQDGAPEYEGNLNAYTDRSSVELYAVTPMTWAVSHGIITGTSDTTLSPRDPATRAQVVVMLHRYLTN